VIVILFCFFVVAVIVRNFFVELWVMAAIVETDFVVVRRVDKVRHCDVCMMRVTMDLLMERQNVTSVALVTLNVL